MSKEESVDIILPNYNSAKYLELTIKLANSQKLEVDYC